MTVPLPHGRVFVPSMLEDDVLRCLAPDTIIDGGLNWLDIIVHNVKQQAGLPADANLPVPRSWNTVSATDDWPLGKLPAVLVITGASLDDPDRGPDGSYMETVTLEVAVIDSARTLFDAQKNAGIYAMSVRLALVQHLLDQPTQSNVLGILAGRLDRRPLPTRSERVDTVAAGLVSFRVVLGDTLNDTSDFTAPPVSPDDLPDAHTAETVTVSVDHAA